VRWKQDGETTHYKPRASRKSTELRGRETGAYVGVQINAHTYAYNPISRARRRARARLSDFLQPALQRASGVFSCYSRPMTDATLYASSV